MSYLTESERRSAGAKRAANTRRLNAQREAQRLQDALYARQKIEAERKVQAPIIEAERAANKEQWLHFWRSQIGAAVTLSDLNVVIKELADWGGYGGGFGSTFDPPRTAASHLNKAEATTAETSTQQTWDQQGEHDRDLEHESRVDYASWETDQEDFE